MNEELRAILIDEFFHYCSHIRCINCPLKEGTSSKICSINKPFNNLSKKELNNIIEKIRNQDRR